MSEAADIQAIASRAIMTALSVYNHAFGAAAWADMVYTASIKDFLRTQQACCAVYACRCALEVAEWIKQPSISGEQRIYNLMAMTRAKAEEARMLAG